jgi:hypothetical protein
MLAQMEPKMDANLKEFIVEIKAWKKRWWHTKSDGGLFGS